MCSPDKAGRESATPGRSSSSSRKSDLTHTQTCSISTARSPLMMLRLRVACLPRAGLAQDFSARDPRKTSSHRSSCAFHSHLLATRAKSEGRL